ncbi:MAG TPA: type 1 glutamine amidotransferase [Acidobacteriota bacterium]|nr:type 1 glutamine amidotransferase [Acidobacteriota bacterium]
MSNVRVLLLQNCELETFGRYAEYLHSNSVDHRLVHAYSDTTIPAHETWDAILVGGTPISAYDADQHEFLRAELAFLRDAINRDVACLGVCCGGQILAQLLGGGARRQGYRELGVYEVRVREEAAIDPLFAGFPSSFAVFHWHGDTFDPPPDGHVLVNGLDGGQQSFRRGRQAGVQFHLETSAAEAARWAEAYADELQEFGGDARAIVRQCAQTEVARFHLADRRMANFLQIARRS